jgi:hypothetical protein
MAYQRQNAILAAIKRETTTGTAATAVGAQRLRITDSPGLELKRSAIQSGEKRADGMKSMGRLGGKSVDGSFNGELTVGADTNMIVEAILRAAFATNTVIGFASVTTVAIGTNVLTAAAGDWVGGQGVRVGDLFRLSGTTVSANNDTNVRVLAVTSLTITVPSGSFTTLAATATGTLTILRKLVTGTTPTRYSHTIEQHDSDIDLSELFLGCRCVGFRVSCRPNQPVTITHSWMGMDRTALTTGTSPWFTSPTLTTGLSLIADDSAIYYNGTTVTTFTGFDLDFQIQANGEPVLSSFVGPDIFDNDLMVTGSITGLRSDFANLTLFDAETEFAVSIKLEELASAPKPVIGFFLPRVKIQSLSAPFGGGDGAKVETLSLMVAPKVAATGYDGSICSVHTNAS